jgi:amino acid adenylation domain-containing protein
MQKDIAIIGMSCRFPGADNPEKFWELISKKQSQFTGIPAERRRLFDFRSLRNPRGSFLENPFDFDNTFFKLSEQEALSMDPQQRIMLELAEEARAHALIQEFEDKNIGVYIGANQRSYVEGINNSFYRNQLFDHLKELKNFEKIPSDVKAELLDEIESIASALPLDASTITGNITNMIASRISHEFNLTGPSLTVDTACSSSLVAVHLACESLKKGESNLAYAGGINLNLTPSIYMLMEAAQVISPTGESIPFSKGSDGILLGEGAGFVLLKRLEDAVEDGDRVLAVIKGSGMNNDGHSIGIMAPSWKGQLRLLESVYKESNYDPKNISLIEAHGTSTRIGDSIEITVLQRFFADQKNSLSIGSAKSNIGHLLGASGMAGLIKTILAITNKKLPPSVISDQVNPKWKLEENDFKIQENLESWEPSAIRAAGVSAFGFGGTNAHIILEEPAPEVPVSKREVLGPPQFSRKKFKYDLFPNLQINEKSFLSFNWKEITLPEKNKSFRPENWLLFCDPEQQTIRKVIEGSLQNVTLIFPGPVFTRTDEYTFTINPKEESHLRWLFQTMDASQSYGILYISNTKEEERPMETISQVLLLKHLFKNSAQFASDISLWCLTNGAYSMSEEDRISPDQRAIASIFSIALNENPKLQGGLIDLELENGKDLELALYLMQKGLDRPVKIKNGSVFQPALEVVSEEESNSAGIKEKGVYLVIGGSSGIGAEIAVHLRKKYNSRVIISGTRSQDKLSARVQSQLDDNFEYRQASVLNQKEVNALVDSVFKKYESLNGVIFAAGIVDYGTFIAADEIAFEKILATKIKGVSNLHKALRNYTVDFVYLLSSVSGLSPAWGSGMSGYATANAYLDGFAERFTTEKTLWLSRSWSIWEDIGMSKDMNLNQPNLMKPIKLSMALQLFEQSFQHKQTHLAVMQLQDAERFSPNWQLKKQQTKKVKISPPKEIVVVSKDVNAVDFKSLLIKMIADATELPESEVNEEESFSNLGLDSISAMDIVGVIEKQFNLSLDPTLLYEYDTVASLSIYLNRFKSFEKPKSFSLLPSQKTFFTNQIFYPEAPCNTLARAEFDKQFEFSILQEAWNILLKKHEGLRLSFEMTDKGPEQSVADIDKVEIKYDEIENFDSSYVGKVEEVMIRKAYLLDQAPLFDVCYIEVKTGSSILLFNAHHIISDAWSVTVLLKDLVEIYSKLSEGNLFSADQTINSFSDYVNHINDKISSEDTSVSRNYWSNELEGFIPLDLPVQAGSLCQDKQDSCIYDAFFDKASTDQIEAIAKQKKVTLFSLLVSGYFKLLQRITKRDDLVIRLASENRDRSFEGVERLVGSLADSIPLRINIKEDDDLVEISQKVKTKLLSAQKHKTASSIDYASILQSRQQCGPVGITPYGMSYVNTDLFLKSFGTDRPQIQSRVALPFTDLSLICLKQNGQLQFSWNYASDTFSEETIKEISDILLEILKATIEKDIKPPFRKETNELEMPKKQLFQEYDLLHEKVFAACDLYGGKVAINENEKLIAYKELKAKSIQLANTIIRLESGNSVVGILDYPGGNATAGILGILAAGHTYVPLDPDWPVGRIEDIINHSGIHTLLTTSNHWQHILPNHQLIGQLKNVLLLDRGQAGESFGENGLILPWIKEYDEGLLPINKSISGESIAYIMYTSGTTGIPKGVMVDHQSVGVFLNWISEEFEITQEDKFIQTSSLGFGGSLRQIFSTLLAGGEIHPIDRYDFKDPHSLLQFMEERGITLFNTVPSVLLNICEYLDQSEEDRVPQLNNLRLMLIGGEVLHGKLVKRWRGRFGINQRIVNLYGSTETIVNATFHQVETDKSFPNGIPIGKPRKGSHVLLLNNEQKPCKPGEKGGLYVGGPSIAKGYYKLPEVSNEKFVTLKVNGLNGIYYKTGDLAKKERDGLYYFFGRNDNQIQIHGNRIEPSEIESVLISSNLVNNAAILDFKEGERHGLTAFVELKNGWDTVNEIDIRNLIAGKLPAYMVPQKVNFIKAFPLTHAGKIDRLKLRHEFGNGTPPNKLEVKPTKTQQIIKEIWKKALKLESIDLNHDFFSIGGDSISALEVLHHLRKTFAIAPKPVELFRKRTIAELAVLLDTLNEKKAFDPSVIFNDKPIPKAQKWPQKHPLSFTQKGFMVLDKLNTKSSPNWVASIPIKGELNFGVLQKAFNYLVLRHPMLRTSFVREGLQSLQKVFPFNDVKIDFKDLSALDQVGIGKTIESLFERYKKMTFTLSDLPLFHLSVIKTGEESAVFMICIHHIIGDAWSLKILIDELQQVYDQIIGRNDISLLRLESNYLSLVKEELGKEKASEDELKKRDVFWRESFTGLPDFELNENWFAKEEDLQKVTLIYSNKRKEILKSICKKKGISLFQLLFTLYAKSLCKVLKVNRILINSSISGRDLMIPGIERVIGCFARSLPVNLALKDSGLMTNIEKVQESFLMSSEYKDLQPRDLMKIYVEKTSGSMQSLYRFFISYMDFTALEDYSSTNITLDLDSADFFFNAGSVESDLLIGIRVAEEIQISFNGRTNALFKNLVKKEMEDQLELFLQADEDKNKPFQKEEKTIDAALIAYFPSLNSFSEFLPFGKRSEKIVKNFIAKLLPGNQPKLLEIEKTAFGRTGIVFIPLFAEELFRVKQEALLDIIHKAVLVCKKHGARHISLAGNLPSRTNYGFSIKAIGNNGSGKEEVVLTTGHSCTVIAVVKTIEKVLNELELKISDLTIGVAGFGSIGQASLNLLLAQIGTPARIIIADLATQLPALEKPLNALKTDYKAPLEIIPVEQAIPDGFYTANLIIGASSSGQILEVDKLLPGTIIVDDSFPPIVNTKQAVLRMKNEKDVLIIGAGKMDIGAKERTVLDTALPKQLIQKIIQKFGDDGLPGCRIESLLMSYDDSLPPTRGLVTLEDAKKYWQRVNDLNLKAVAFHLQGYEVGDDLIKNVKQKISSTHGQIKK